MSAASIALEVAEAEGQPFSAQTIRCTLQQVSLHGCRPRRKPLLKLGSQESLQTVCWRQLFQEHELLEPCPVVWWVYGKLVWLRWCPGCVVTPWWGVPRKFVSCLQSTMVVVASWSGAAWLLLVLGRCGSLRETWIPTYTVTFWSRRWCTPFRNWVKRQFSNKITTPNTPPRWQLPCWWSWRWWWWSGQVCLQTWTLLSTCGASSSEGGESTMCLTSNSSMMPLWRSGRGCQQQPVQLWWIPCPGGLRQC